MIFDWKKLRHRTPCFHCGKTIRAGMALYLAQRVFCSQTCARAATGKGKK